MSTLTKTQRARVRAALEFDPIFQAEIRAAVPLADDERHALALMVRAGDQQAREEMIRAFRPLAIKIACRFARARPSLKDDLTQESFLGLIRAVEGYDPGQNKSWMGYAATWIKRSAIAAMSQQGSMTRVTPRSAPYAARLRKAEARLASRPGPPPRPEDVELASGLTRKQALMGRQARAAQSARSLDVPTRDGRCSRRDQLPGRPGDDAASIACLAEVLRAVECPGLLSVDAIKTIRLRFGLDSGEPMPQKEVARTLHMARYRVVALERAAIARLREAFGEAD